MFPLSALSLAELQVVDLIGGGGRQPPPRSLFVGASGASRLVSRVGGVASERRAGESEIRKADANENCARLRQR
jgi:hypothetical protein